jgi:protein SCO1/2
VHVTRQRRGLIALIAVAAAALAAALVLALAQPSGRRAEAPVGGGAFAGAALPAGVPAPDFTLTDQTGRRVSPGALRGQVTVLAFLASTCGPACTLIAQQIRGALDELGRAVPVLLVSVDPAGDTPARVRSFLAGVSLAGRVRYLTGTPEALRSVWRAYRIEPLSAGRGAFERSATVVLLDRAGHERVLFGLEQLTPEALAHDIRKLG